MKKTICLILAALLLFSGCQAQVSETTSAPETTEAPTEIQVPEITVPETLPGPTLGIQTQEEIWFRNPGKARITYTGMRNSVQYITSVEQLPDEEALKGYDEAFFEKYALVVLVETVSSGSVQLEVASVTVSGNQARVNLSRSISGDVGTTDMATWLIWVEVEKGLTYDWVLENASKVPEVSKY